jgi:hypothetical protein
VEKVAQLGGAATKRSIHFYDRNTIDDTIFLQRQRNYGLAMQGTLAALRGQ